LTPQTACARRRQPPVSSSALCNADSAGSAANKTSNWQDRHALSCMRPMVPTLQIAVASAEMCRRLRLQVQRCAGDEGMLTMRLTHLRHTETRVGVKYDALLLQVWLESPDARHLLLKAGKQLWVLQARRWQSRPSKAGAERAFSAILYEIAGHLAVKYTLLGFSPTELLSNCLLDVLATPLSHSTARSTHEPQMCSALRKASMQP
jgi:hypothetical protein